MLAAVSHYLGTTDIGNIAIETNNAVLQRVCEAAGLKLQSTYDNYYVLSKDVLGTVDEAQLFAGAMHETQATGDVLPT